MSVKIYMGKGVDVCEDLHGERGRCLLCEDLHGDRGRCL